MLRQFGVMGSVYMEQGDADSKSAGRSCECRDRGSSKGGDLACRRHFRLLRDSGLNFVGNIEAREIPADAADVVVADGFTGNVILKAV